MTHPFALKKIHHVAYRCHDAKVTADWYAQMLGIGFTTAFSEDHVPSTGAYDPYMHIFLDCGGGNVIAFFELPNQPAMGRDPNTPEWVQHIAFQVADFDTLLVRKRIWRLKASPFWARRIMVFSGRSISSTPMATGWSLPVTSVRRTNMPNYAVSRR